MVIFRDPHGHRMITTPVKRILGEHEGQRLYVETENSVYRLEIHGEPVQSSRAASQGDRVADPASSNSSSAH
ncbi:hypothetical protein [Haliangium ochraceum]|nr:hypothetical protein [Haliangium ochraceum]